MEDFRIIYRILKYLQQSMDFEEFGSMGGSMRSGWRM